MNKNLLRAKIKENGFTQAEVAKLIGISSNSLSRKISGKQDFRLGEIKALIKILNIERVEQIFLA